MKNFLAAIHPTTVIHPSIKVQILWEGHKFWKNYPNIFEITYLVTSKENCRFFQISLAFSKYLNFIARKIQGRNQKKNLSEAKQRVNVGTYLKI